MMKISFSGSSRSVVFLAALLTVVVLASLPAAAASFPAMYSARAMGMGGAFTAVSDDATALYWNPAALGLRSISVNVGAGLSGTGDLGAFQELSENPDEMAAIDFEGDARFGIGLLAGINVGSIGAGYLVDGSADLHKSTGATFDGELEMQRSVAVGIARDIAGDGRSGLMGIRVGGVLRSVDGARAYYKTDEFGQSDEGEETGKGYAADLGVLLRLTDVFTVGASARNIIGETKWTDSGTESPGTEFRLGVALQPPLLGGTIAADIATGGQFRYGIEKKLLLGALRLRLGQIHSDAGTWTTGGAGFALGPVNVDAALISRGDDALHYAVEAGVRF